VISDTGPGIAAQDASLVFMPFFSTKERGMGLGLTVANRIMEQHDGRLELRNSSNKGGVFALRLPASRANSNAQPDA
jgi:C4-dicarboxylate-specific signal transduction histidine kinase